MYYQGEIEKKDRRKVITIATAIVAIVLLLIVSIIVVATRKTGENVGGTDNASFAIDETSQENSDSKEEEKKEEIKKETETVTVTTKPAAESTSAAPSNPIPETGPEDILPLAISLGSITAAGTAYVMSRKQK